MRSPFRSIVLFAAGLGLAGPVTAQVVSGGPLDTGLDWTRASRFELGIGATYAQAAHEFSRYVDHGWGANVSGTFRLDRRGVLGIRGDAALMEYGSETKRVPLSPTVNRVLVDMTTSNNIGVISIGPELRLPVGPVRPFVNAAIALAIFTTGTSVGGSDNGNETNDFASSKNYSDETRAYRLGGGLYLPFGRGGWNGGITLGAAYYAGGKASYLQEGGIKDNANGTITLTPIRSRTEFWSYDIGMRVVLPKGD